MLEEFHGERSLEGYNPWGKEADTTEGLTDLFKICSAKYLQQKKRKFLPGAMSVIIMQLKKKKNHQTWNLSDLRKTHEPRIV